MRGASLAVMLLVPLAASADTSVRDPASDCLVVVRRALAADYPNDTGENRFCTRDRSGLACHGDCDDWSCHTDACIGWTTSIYVSAAGRVEAYASSYGDFAREHEIEAQRQTAKARRVLARCLAQ